MKALKALWLVLAVGACGQDASAPRQGQGAGNSSVVLASTQNLPDWLLVARQRDCPRDAAEQCPLGEVHFNQRTITRNPDGTADIWVQAKHGQPQLFQTETATAETTVRFDTERLHYRFNCAESTFVVVERQIMGANETVVARDEPRQIYRAPGRGSVTAIVMPIACRGG